MKGKVWMLLVVFGILMIGLEAKLLYKGVSQSCLEWGHGSIPGKLNTDYFAPDPQSIAYMKNKGMNVIRLPFLWERLQPTLGGNFDATYQKYIDDAVNYSVQQGMYVILDVHNYLRYNTGGGDQVVGGQGSSVSLNHLSDLWKRLGTLYGGNNKIMFGLMNEPHDVPTELVLSAMQAAMNGLRESGAAGLALVPGNAWTGAHSWAQNWYGTPNANVMGGITDSKNNYAFELHQYFDSDYSGTKNDCSASFDSSKVLADVTNWLRTNGKKGLVGEFGIPETQNCYTAARNFLDFLEANSDVWIGWTAWAAGPKWGNGLQVLEPTNYNPLTERPGMAILTPYLDSGVANVSSSTNGQQIQSNNVLGSSTVAKGSFASFLFPNLTVLLLIASILSILV